MRALIVGTGYSLRAVLDQLDRFDGLIFTCNNTYQDVRTDVWLACDPAWHEHYGQVTGPFDKWHWDAAICERFDYRHVEGVWMVDGVAYPRSEFEAAPGPVGWLWLEDKSRISLNHASGPQLLNLALNQYGCEEAVLIGHDFRYIPGKPRHYFTGLSEIDGEYPAEIRKHSEFDKQGKGHDLLAVYREISKTPGCPPIYNATEGSALPWFPYRALEDFLK